MRPPRPDSPATRRPRSATRWLLPAGVLLLGGCAAGPGGSLPARASATGGVLVVSDRGGAYRIYEVDPRDGAARLVGSADPSDTSYRDSMPARLPDGRIVFVSDRDGTPEIYLTDASGRSVTRLIREPRDPAPAAADSAPGPLGRDRIVFARTEAGAPAGAPRDLYLMRLDGTGLRRLTRSPADDSAPMGSPEGVSVVFVSDRSGAPHIHLMPDVDAADPETKLIDLTRAVLAPAGMPESALPFADGAPVCLEDGSIVFSRAHAGSPPYLFLMGSAGGRRTLREITDPLTLPYGADEPVALPDGSVLFVTGPGPPPKGTGAPPRFEVYRIETGGFNLSRVSRSQARYSDFTRLLSRR